MQGRWLPLVAIATVVGLIGFQSSRGARQEDEMMELYGLFVDAVEQIEANYVKPVSRRELIEAGLRGMTQSLDQHTGYINTRDWKVFRRQLEGSFGGIGIQVGSDERTRRLKVLAPMVGTPAHKAGILAGDLILEVDGKSTEGINIDQAIEFLQGRPGTDVRMKILHEGATEPVEVTVTRALIDVPSVLGDRRKPDGSWDYLLDKENKIAYVRMTGFIAKTVSELSAALDAIKEQGFKGLILDLRDNPGGLLSQAVEISDMFVDSGRIVSTKGRNVAEKVYEAKREGTLPEFPMAILVNGNSASASEILSACLQDHNRAKVIGSRTFGKGSVQNIIELEDGESVLKLTVATYWRPSGKNIHRFESASESDEWGVSPNEGLEVELSTKEYRDWAVARRKRDLEILKDNPTDAAPDATAPFEDKVLDKALEVIRAELGVGG